MQHLLLPLPALLLLLSFLGAVAGSVDGLSTTGPSCAVPNGPAYLPLPRCPATNKTLEDAKQGEASPAAGARL